MGLATAGLFLTRANGVLALLICISVIVIGSMRSSAETEQERPQSRTRRFRHPLALCAIVLAAFFSVWFAYGYLSSLSGQGFQVTPSNQGPISLLFGTNMDREGRYNVPDRELAGYAGENRLPLAQANERAMKIAIERIANDPIGFVSFSLTDKVAQLWGREYSLYIMAVGDLERIDKLNQLRSSSLRSTAASVTDPSQPPSVKVWPLVFISLDGVYRITLLLFLFMLIREIRRPSLCLALGIVAFLLSIPHILIEVQPPLPSGDDALHHRRFNVVRVRHLESPL